MITTSNRIVSLGVSESNDAIGIEGTASVREDSLVNFDGDVRSVTDGTVTGRVNYTENSASDTYLGYSGNPALRDAACALVGSIVEAVRAREGETKKED